MIVNCVMQYTYLYQKGSFLDRSILVARVPSINFTRSLGLFIKLKGRFLYFEFLAVEYLQLSVGKRE